MPQRGRWPAWALVVLALATATSLGGAAQTEDTTRLTIAADDDSCPGSGSLCLVVLEGHPRRLEPGDQVELRFENAAAHEHTLFLTGLGAMDPGRDTSRQLAFSGTGDETVPPDHHATLRFTVPDVDEGLYLWCDLPHHESQGMYMEAAFLGASAPADPSPRDDGLDDGTVVALVAGGVLAGLAALAWLLRDKLRYGVLALYTRLRKRELLDHEDRARIVDLVREQPGIHFRELARRLDLGHGILDHHLRKLADAAFIEEHTTESHRCYFPSGGLGPEEREALASVKAGGAQRVMQALAEHPDISITRVAEHAGLARSTASHHVSRLTDVGIVETERRGREKRLRLTRLGQDVLEHVGDQRTAA